MTTTSNSEDRPNVAIREVPDRGLTWDCNVCDETGRLFEVTEDYEDPDSVVADVFDAMRTHVRTERHRLNEVHADRAGRRS